MWTHISLNQEEGILRVETEGDRSILPGQRVLHVELVGAAPASVWKGEEELPVTYDAARKALCFSFVMNREMSEITVRLDGLRLQPNDWQQWTRSILQKAQTSNDEKEMIWRVLRCSGNTPEAFGTLQTLCSSPALLSSLAEAMFAEKGERVFR